MTEDQTDPTLGPDGTAAVGLNPGRCAFIWNPYEAVDPSRRVRCTARADEEHAHHWSSVEDEHWTDATREALLAALPVQALAKPQSALPIRLAPPREERPTEPTEAQIEAGLIAFHEAIVESTGVHSARESWRGEVTAAIRAALSA